MKIAIALLSLLAVVSFAGTTAIGATPSPEVTIPMHAQNGSGEDGTATLSQEGGDVKVVISLKGAPSADAAGAHSRRHVSRPQGHRLSANQRYVRIVDDDDQEREPRKMAQRRRLRDQRSRERVGPRQIRLVRQHRRAELDVA